MWIFSAWTVLAVRTGRRYIFDYRWREADVKDTPPLHVMRYFFSPRFEGKKALPEISGVSAGRGKQ